MDKGFVRDYILRQVNNQVEGNAIQLVAGSSLSPKMNDYDYIKVDTKIVFYKNTGNGMEFNVYDAYYFRLIKTETLTTNSLRIVNESLKVDEDGNFYMIGYVTPTNSQEEVFALVLLNDIINEEVVIRKYYILSNYEIDGEALYCEKKKSSADYLFVSYYNRNLLLTQLTLNVQNGNTYLKWIISHRFHEVAVNGVGFQYNSDTSKIMIIMTVTDASMESCVIICDLNKLEPNETHYLVFGSDEIYYRPILYLNTNLKVKPNGISNFIFMYGSKFYEYTIENNFDNVINIEIGGQVKWYDNTYIVEELVINNTLYLKIRKYEIFNNNIQLSSKYILYNINSFRGTNYTVELIHEDFYNLSMYRILITYGTSNFDAYFITTNSTAPYISYNKLVPNFVNIQDNYYNYVFSRKITDKNIIGNQLTAEVNIPYYMLNDVNLTGERLIGQTNQMIQLENKSITKNEYESLYLNFINHINVIDNNFNRNELQNEISSLLAESLFTDKAETNYQVAPIWWIKSFKTNGETEIQAIPYSSIIQISDYVYKFNIIVDGSTVNQIQLLAKDQKTPYITIPLYSINGVARIQQTMRFE